MNFSQFFLFIADGVLEFIVLKSKYDAALAVPWKPGMRCVAVMDGDTYGATVRTVVGDIASNPWQSIHVEWDSTSGQEPVNPWEISQSAEQHHCPLVSCIDAHQREKISELLTESMSDELNEALLAPVDYATYPTYCKVVSKPCI
jgi:hypothetical protein